MNHVYIIRHRYDYDGSEIVAVYVDEQKAIDYVLEYQKTDSPRTHWEERIQGRGIYFVRSWSANGSHVDITRHELEE